MNMDKDPFRVLALEGGGMRGYYTATLLDALCRLFGDRDSIDLGKNLNLICGTSTGAILACAIAKGIPFREIISMYRDRGKNIFPRPMPSKLWLQLCWAIRFSFGHAAKEARLKEALQGYFGDTTLEDVYKERNICLCVPTVNASDHRAWVFKTPHLPRYTRDKKYKLSDVCMASAAAPIFFSPHAVKNPSNPDNIEYFVDGGLWANSPTLVALVEALNVAAPDQDIHILSAGTVPTPNGDPNELKKNKWGAMQWKLGIGIMDMSLSAQSYGHNSMASLIAKAFSEEKRTIKVMQLAEKPKSPNKYSAIGIDKADGKAISTMSEMAESDARENHSLITTKDQNQEILGFFRPQQPQEKHHEQEKKLQ